MRGIFRNVGLSAIAGFMILFISSCENPVLDKLQQQVLYGEWLNDHTGPEISFPLSKTMEFLYDDTILENGSSQGNKYEIADHWQDGDGDYFKIKIWNVTDEGDPGLHRKCLLLISEGGTKLTGILNDSSHYPLNIKDEDIMYDYAHYHR